MAVRDRARARRCPAGSSACPVDADGDPRLPARPADPRAAHPPREGHQQHLHRAGAAGRSSPSMYAVYHGPDGPAGDRRRACTATPAPSPPRCAAAGRRGRARRRSSTPSPCGSPARRATIVAAADEHGHQPAPRRRRPRRHRLDETPPTSRASSPPSARPPSAPTGERRLRPTALRAAGRRWCATVATYLTHPVFHPHRSETAMLRYLRRLSDHDLALDRTMIPLGSCTMKLNATAEMEPITWPEFAASTRSPRSTRPPGYARADRRPRGLAGRDHRLRPRCRCSPTPGRRASSPACWPSAATTAPAATTSATSA